MIDCGIPRSCGGESNLLRDAMFANYSPVAAQGKHPAIPAYGGIFFARSIYYCPRALLLPRAHGVIRTLARQPGYSGAVSVPRIDSRQIVSACEQLGKHSDGGAGCLAFGGSGGTLGHGTVTGGVLGCCVPHADVSSATLVSNSSRNGSLGFILYYLQFPDSTLFLVPCVLLSVGHGKRVRTALSLDLGLHAGQLRVVSPALGHAHGQTAHDRAQHRGGDIPSGAHCVTPDRHRSRSAARRLTRPGSCRPPAYTQRGNWLHAPRTSPALSSRNNVLLAIAPSPTL